MLCYGFQAGITEGNRSDFRNTTHAALPKGHGISTPRRGLTDQPRAERSGVAAQRREAARGLAAGRIGLPLGLMRAPAADDAGDVPLAVAVGTTWLPRVSPSMLKLDRCRRWANPAARPGLIAATSMLGGVIGATLAVFLGAIHLLVVDANASSPARMDQPAFVGLIEGRKFVPKYVEVVSSTPEDILNAAQK